MSELTSCNYCQVQYMKRQAKREGTNLSIHSAQDGEMQGWVSAQYLGKDKPSAYFLELTDHCVC